MHKLFLGLGTLVVLFLFSPTVSAISGDVVIYQLQTSVSGNASSEYVSIKNIGVNDLEVTDWCIVYSSASDATQTILKCLAPPDDQTKLWLSSGGYATFATNEFISNHVGFVPTGIFNAGISATGGHLKLLDKSKNTVDKLGWGTAVSPETTAKTAHATGYILQRFAGDSDNNAADFTQTTLVSLPSSDVYEEVLTIDVCPNTSEIDINVPVGYMKDTDGNCYFDICDNLSGLQKVLPTSFYQENIDCYSVMIKINEILPNVSGPDTGKEYIEFYNPTVHDTNLIGYYLQVGPSFSKNYDLPNVELKSGQYVNINDTQSKVTLSNTSASLRLFSKYEELVDETSIYENPPDDQAWALFADSWRFTNQPSPGFLNKESTEISGRGAGGVNLKPCPEGKYRNPETNRCRKIETADSLKPCNVDQIRNPETNRCRSIFSTSGSLKPCKVGQTRNPETNRCRKITASNSNLKPCASNQERNPETNRCRKKKTNNQAIGEAKDVESETVSENSGMFLVGGATMGLATYGVAEWRSEIASGARRLRNLLGKNPPTD